MKTADLNKMYAPIAQNVTEPYIADDLSSASKSIPLDRQTQYHKQRCLDRDADLIQILQSNFRDDSFYTFIC